MNDEPTAESKTPEQPMRAQGIIFAVVSRGAAPVASCPISDA